MDGCWGRMGGLAFCSWEGRPPCRPLPMRERLTGLSALGHLGLSCGFQSTRCRHGGRPSQQISLANRLTAKKPPRQTEALETLAIRDRGAVA